MKQIQRTMQSAVKDIKKLTLKMENIQKQLNRMEGSTSTKRTVKTSPARSRKITSAGHAVQRRSRKVTAYDTALAVINRSRKGITVAQLRERTGFNEKKVWNLLYKAKKQGKIKNTQRGVYIKA